MKNSLVERNLLPIWAKAKGFNHCFVYRGQSMNPTFQNGDFLYIQSTNEKLMRGDVIVFNDLPRKGFIVHRIISVSPDGFVTRGDHNRNIDSIPISRDQLIGKVELVENKRGTIPVLNGLRGLWLARLWITLIWLEQWFRKVFRIPYKLFRQSGLATMFWRPNIARIQIKNMDGSLVKYIYKEHTIATWDPAQGIFDCRKPFDLVIPHPKNQ